MMNLGKATWISLPSLLEMAGLFWLKLSRNVQSEAENEHRKFQPESFVCQSYNKRLKTGASNERCWATLTLRMASSSTDSNNES